MKRFFSLALAAFTLASSLASCAVADVSPASGSSSVCADEAWLEARLGGIPADVTVGTADELGLDMSAFEDDGYLIRTEGGATVVAGKTADGLDRAVRAYAKAYEAGEGVADAVYHEGYRIGRLTVAGNDISEYRISYEGGTDVCVTDRTSDSAYCAAAELARLVEKACGVALPVVPAASAKTGKTVSVGYLTDGSHGENGFTYSVSGGNVAILGAPEGGGCLNAVWYFLENELGWAGLTSGDSVLAEAEHVDVPDGASADVDPLFDYLRAEAADEYAFANDRGFGYYGRIPHADHGIEVNEWVTPDAHWLQPCYSDADYLEAAYDGLWNHFSAHPEKEYADIGCTESAKYCVCKTCLTTAKAENGTHAGAIVRFANALDGLISEDFDGKKLLILATDFCNVPPVTAPSDNVYVTFDTTGCCRDHLIDGSEGCTATNERLNVTENVPCSNADYAAWIRGWCDLSPNVYVIYDNPADNLDQMTADHTLYNDIRFFADCGVRGLFCDGGHCDLGESRLRLAELAIMQFHPDFTRAEYDAAVADLYEREFGDGGQYLLAYTRNIWSPAQYKSDCATGFGYPPEPFAPTTLDAPSFLAGKDEAVALCDRAIALADCEKMQLAAERFSLDVLYKICRCAYFPAYDSGDTDTIAELEDLYSVFWERFLRLGTNGVFRGNTVCDDLTDAAWTNWVIYRDLLSGDGEQKDAPAEANGRAITLNIDKAGRDPFVLPYDGHYYVYTTGWRCWKNDALTSDGWEYVGMVVKKPADYDTNPYAPEVYEIGGKFYMFTTYHSTETGLRGCAIFVADSPEGKFKLWSDGIVTPPEWDCIDGTPYFDEDGQPWMVFVRNYPYIDDGVGRMYCAKMSDDLKHFTSDVTLLFRCVDAKWARTMVTDGPFMYTTEDGQLLMLWSSMDYGGYAVGVARSESGTVLGPWTHDDLPLYAKNPLGDEGGHGMIFRDFDGNLWLSLHSPNEGDALELPTFVPIKEIDGNLVRDNGKR